MTFKLVTFTALVAIAQAGNLGYVASPVAYSAPVVKYIAAESSAPAQYDFGYTVSDPHTGDQKSQHESRHGDVVQGSYSLVDSDGTKRTVEYSADAHNGFNAVVHKEPIVTAKVSSPAAIASPVISHVPITYASSAPLVSKYTLASSVPYSAPLVAPSAAKFLAAPAVAPVTYATAPAALTYGSAVPLAAKYVSAPAYSAYHH